MHSDRSIISSGTGNIGGGEGVNLKRTAHKNRIAYAATALVGDCKVEITRRSNDSLISKRTVTPKIGVRRTAPSSNYDNNSIRKNAITSDVKKKSDGSRFCNK